MDTTYFFADRPIILSQFEGHLFHAIATTQTQNLHRLHRSPHGAIAAIQLDLLFFMALESPEPAALMALAPWRLIYGNEATGGKKVDDRRSLSENWSEEECDRYLMALVRDGGYSGSGVRSELFTLADGRKIVLQRRQA
jgi:hypothetical protein